MLTKFYLFHFPSLVGIMSELKDLRLTWLATPDVANYIFVFTILCSGTLTTSDCSM